MRDGNVHRCISPDIVLFRKLRDENYFKIRRKAGEDRAGTQGCLRQEARPTSSGSEAGKYIPGSDARRSIRGSDAAAQEASQVNRQRSTVLRQE